MTDDIVRAAEQITAQAVTDDEAAADPTIAAWLAEGPAYELGVAAGRRLGPDLDNPDYTFTLTINDYQREQLLNSNQRIDRRVRDERVKYWRDRTKGEMHNAIHRGEVARLQRAWIFATMTWPDNRKRDAANWHGTYKAALDGAVAAGLLPGDDDRHLIGPDMRSAPGKGPMGITFAIYDLGAAL